MTDAEAEALGRRLVACRHFRPMRGMRDLQGRTWTPDLLWRWTPGVDVPDLRDPATRGCVLELARAAHSYEDLHPRISAVRLADGGLAWEIIGWTNPDLVKDGRGGSWRVFGFASEAQALVAALENAP